MISKMRSCGCGASKNRWIWSKRGSPVELLCLAPLQPSGVVQGGTKARPPAAKPTLCLSLTVISPAQRRRITAVSAQSVICGPWSWLESGKDKKTAEKSLLYKSALWGPPTPPPRSASLHQCSFLFPSCFIWISPLNWPIWHRQLGVKYTAIFLPLMVWTEHTLTWKHHSELISCAFIAHKLSHQCEKSTKD